MNAVKSAVVILLAFAALLVSIASCAPSADAADTKIVTVVSTFPVSGSGWRIESAIAQWNDNQTTVRFVLSTTPGVTTVYLHRYNARDGWGGYALGGDVWLNERYHTDNGCQSEQTVAHELGHTLGLVHSLNAADLMYGEGRIRIMCGKPSKGDVAALAMLYRATI